jgi:hypothetical protein
MRHIKAIIFKRQKSLNISQANKEDIFKKLGEIIKQKSASMCSALFYKNKTIYIQCPSSGAANELYLIQEEIKYEANKLFSKKILERIVVKTK